MLAVPAVEDVVDVPALLAREGRVCEQSPRLDGVVVLDGRLEVLAAGQGLPQLPAEPSHQADTRLVHMMFLHRSGALVYSPSVSEDQRLSDDEPPICTCGVTMVPAELSARGAGGEWVCLECEETYGAEDDGSYTRRASRSTDW